MATVPSPSLTREFLSRWAAGDQEAAALLFPAYLAKVLVALRRIGHREEDSMELAQEAFLRLIQWMREGNPPPRDLTGFLLVAARNAFRDRRHRKERYTGLAALKDSTAPTESPEEAAQRKELMNLLRIAVERLPDHCRRIYELRLEGQKVGDIAAQLGYHVGTVKAYLHEGVGRLRQSLGTVIRRMAA